MTVREMVNLWMTRRRIEKTLPILLIKGHLCVKIAYQRQSDKKYFKDVFRCQICNFIVGFIHGLRVGTANRFLSFTFESLHTPYVVLSKPVMSVPACYMSFDRHDTARQPITEKAVPQYSRSKALTLQFLLLRATKNSEAAKNSYCSFHRSIS